ncbi:MAG: beta-propeller domain-containing protein [Ruminococcus sp.]|nr:beta-propeller domain-containing protein [Ruminococcus sp.]
MNRFDELKSMMQEPNIPERLSPESIKQALDEQQSKGKEKTIRRKTRLRWIAGIAACGVVASTGGYAAYRAGMGNDENGGNGWNLLTADAGNYCTASDSYDAVAAFMAHYAEKEAENIYWYDGAVAEEAVESAAESSLAFSTGDIDSSFTQDVNSTALGENPESAAGAEYSETYNQDQGVLESDIVLTDGEYLYCKRTGTGYDHLVEIVPAADGAFGEKITLDVSADLSEIVSSFDIHSMYLKDGRLTVIAEGIGRTEGVLEVTARTYVFVYETGTEPVLLGCYSQDGYANDVRMMEDGTLYLITNYNWYDRYAEDQIEDCIPAYGCDGVYTTAAPEDILLPAAEVSEESGSAESVSETAIETKDEIIVDFSDSFTNIGSINVLSDTPAESVDYKSLAGFSGEMYCSLENIYISSYSYWRTGSETTEFTKLAIDGGMITPTAAASVAGYVKDQFSMSEYNGYFRAAVTQQVRTETRDEYVASMSIERSNAVYVFDSNMEQVGALEGIAPTETIKSANFQGDMLYLVTFRQTDPLFSIDLSDPANPVILDEYKITGYSTYMQQWDENLLIGFGVDADENGWESGLKLVMFDNSDPNNLMECGYMPIRIADIISDPSADGYAYSEAISERKALLIAPEKNLIAVPVDGTWIHNITKMHITVNCFALYSYENGSFAQLGVYNTEVEHRALRSLYIGDYAYLVNSGGIIAVDLTTMQETDRITF